MANYTGSKCEICKKNFANDDDIVVCPDCGTPYHRECYLEKGECVNYELHERGGDWQTFYGDKVDISSQNNAQEEFSEKNDDVDNEDFSDSTSDSSDGSVKCPRCGEPNPPAGLFCKKCGMPLTFNQEFRPFNNMGNGGFENHTFTNAKPINLLTEDFDGVKGEKLQKFVRKNPVYFLANFLSLKKNNSKFSFNLSAILFPEYYFFYRKMYAIGFLALALATILEIPTLLLYIIDGTLQGITLPAVIVNNQELVRNIGFICSSVRMVMSITCGVLANYLYFKKAIKTIKEIDLMDISEDEKDNLIESKGGTSGLSVGIAITANVSLVIIMLIGIAVISKYF